VEGEEKRGRRELRTQGTLRAVRREGGMIILMGADNNRTKRKKQG